MRAVLDEIKPSKEESKVLKSAANHFIKKLDSKLKNAKSIIGGSVAKDSFLKGDYDIDIFVQFEKEKYKNKDISEILHTKLKFIFKSTSKITGLHKVHGSRDYFQIKQDPFTFEIIPILKIKKAEEAENITDISPLHTEFVKQYKHLVDEIRLLKAFCKANNLYGAESYIRGFSGYTLEVLIIAHNSFENLMKAASRWKIGTRIDVKKHGVEKLNKSKLSPLIVIDPVQPDRNTAAALSEKKFNEFVNLAKEFLHNPSPEFFKHIEFDLERIKSASILRVIPLKGKDDIVGAKLIKCMEYIHRKLKEEGYEVTEYNWHWDKEVYFWYFVKSKNLPSEKKHYGPPVKEKKHFEGFTKKYCHNKIKDDGFRVYVELKRKHININSFLKELVQKDIYIREKVKQIKVL